MKFVLFYLFFSTLGAALEDVSKLSLRGEGVIKRSADQVKFSVAVTTEAETTQKALEENSKKMERVVESLKRAHLKSLTYETGTFSVQPRYTTRPVKASMEWKPQIEGYQVQNSLNVTMEELVSVPELLDALVDAGANSIGDLQFVLKDEKECKEKAIELAYQAARREALVLAKAADQKLGKVLFLSLDDSHVTPFMMKSGALFSRSLDQPPIQAGDVEVRASVNAIYQLD